MASAQFHYQRAENMMQALAKAADSGTMLPNTALTTMLAQAQVHATLAAAAVAAEATAGRLVVLDPDGPSLRPHGQAMS